MKIDLCQFQLKKLPMTNVGHPQCYAAYLMNCNGPISREHFISENILNQIGSISRKGIPWLKESDGDNLPPNALARNSLCKAHNSFLSPLDQIAGKLFEELCQLHKSRKRTVFIPGDSLNRFMLKSLFGLLSTNKFEHKGQKLTAKSIDRSWLEVLFNGVEFPKETGIYFEYKEGDPIPIEKRIRVAMVIPENDIVGLQVSLGGVNFLFSLAEKRKAFNKGHPRFEALMYQPKLIKNSDSTQEYHFIW